MAIPPIKPSKKKTPPPLYADSPPVPAGDPVIKWEVNNASGITGTATTVSIPVTIPDYKGIQAAMNKPSAQAHGHFETVYGIDGTAAPVFVADPPPPLPHATAEEFYAQITSQDLPKWAAPSPSQIENLTFQKQMHAKLMKQMTQAPVPGGASLQYPVDETFVVPSGAALNQQTLGGQKIGKTAAIKKAVAAAKAQGKKVVISPALDKYFDKTSVIKNDPANYVKNPAFDKDFQAQLAAEAFQEKINAEKGGNIYKIPLTYALPADFNYDANTVEIVQGGATFTGNISTGHDDKKFVTLKEIIDAKHTLDQNSKKEAAFKKAYEEIKEFSKGFNTPIITTATEQELIDMGLKFVTAHTQAPAHAHAHKGVSEGEATAQISEAQEPQSEFAVTTEEAQSEVLQLVDEYTAIQREIDKLDIAPQLKKQAELKTQLQSIAKSDHYPASKPVQLWGTHKNYVEFSAQNNTTKIADKDGLVSAIGLDAWIANTEITLAAAKKIMSENELSKFTTTVPGARTMKAVVLGDDPSVDIS